MIAVTGGSGLVGQHLLAALTAVQPVRVLYRKTKPVFRLPVRDDRIEWIQGDVTDSGSLDAFCSGADKLYHLAGMVSYQPGDKEALMLQNATGTANLVNAALAHGVKKMVYLSSIAALGDEKNREVNENSTREPGESRTAYSISKWEAEKEVWRGVAEGLEAVILNPGIILGESDLQRSSSRLFAMPERNFPYYTSGVTAWVDVQDLVRIMQMAMDGVVSGERFIVSAGNYSFKEVMTWMATHMQRKAPHREAGPWQIAVARLGDRFVSMLKGEAPTLTQESIRIAQTRQLYNNRKWLSTFPDFQYSPLEQSLARIIAWQRAQGLFV